VGFTKMSGGGNDFLVLGEDQAPPEPERPAWVRRVCRRGLSVGADGVLVLGESPAADVRLVHYNADGGRPELCGNGARCAARWARLRRGGDGPLTLETDAGPVEARFPSPERVAIRFPFRCGRPRAQRLDLGELALDGFFLEVGIPHFLAPVESLEDYPVHRRGRRVREHPDFGARGTNATFLSRRDDGSLDLRTLERGVEAEVLACGTACVAAAVLAVDRGWSRSPVVCHTRSGIDLVAGLRGTEAGFEDLSLEGDARVIYRGNLHQEALAWTDR
jgi:diaminopimelate epimerase